MIIQKTPPPAGQVDRRLRQAAIILLGLALLAFLIYLFIYFRYAFALFRLPFDYDQGEGYELLDTILFSQGQLHLRP